MNRKPPNLTLSEAAVAALQRGNKIEAIKLLRMQQGIGLKEAKDLVEAYLRTQPALQSTFDTKQVQIKQSTLLWIIVLIGAGLLYFLFAKR
jgi:ribosomal protein L7/L12